MSKVINTDRELQALKGEAKRYERAVSKARGLSVLVYPSGCKSFVARYLAGNGARRRLLLGDYPGLSLADARLKASALRGDIADGADPAAERAAARAEVRLGETFDELSEAYFAAAAIGLHGGRKRPLRPHTIERQKGLWAKHLRPIWGKRRYRDIRRADVRQYMHGLVTQGVLSASSIASIGDVLRAFFTYALDQDLVEANPTVKLVRPIAPESRSRMFKEEALGRILAALLDASQAPQGRADPHARLEPPMALALRFLVLTLTRRAEATAAMWPEIDRKANTWTIPGSRTKNRQVHVVPLSPQAMAVLDAASQLPNATKDGYVFPKPTNALAHVDPHGATRAVSRLCERFELPAGSPHDFRRTGATILTGETHRVRRFIVGKVLGHTANDGPAVTAVYDRNEYLTEKREALEAWGRHVDGLTCPAPAGAPKRRAAHLRLVAA